MLNPAGTFSCAIGGWSAAAASGGPATGASFAAASPSGRPISGEPGGSGLGLACWATAPTVMAQKKTPASQKLRGEDVAIMSFSPSRAVAILTPNTSAGADSLPRAHFLNFQLAWQPETSASLLREKRVCPAGIEIGRRCMARRLVPGYRSIGRVDQGFRERKLQDDLAIIVGDLDDGIEQHAIGALGLDQLEDHGACDFPGAVRVAQLLALGIVDQFIADPGVEEIPWHPTPMGPAAKNWKPGRPHKFFIRYIRMSIALRPSGSPPKRERTH